MSANKPLRDFFTITDSPLNSPRHMFGEKTDHHGQHSGEFRIFGNIALLLTIIHRQHTRQAGGPAGFADWGR